MKCKDCCSYRPSDFDKDWGTCKESLLTVSTDKECSLYSKEKQSQYKKVRCNKWSAKIVVHIEIITIFL